MFVIRSVHHHNVRATDWITAIRKNVTVKLNFWVTRCNRPLSLSNAPSSITDLNPVEPLKLHRTELEQHAFNADIMSKIFFSV